VVDEAPVTDQERAPSPDVGALRSELARAQARIAELESERARLDDLLARAYRSD